MLKPKEVRQIYASYADIYDRVFARFFESRVREALSNLKLSPGSKILEVGVGTGLSFAYYPRDCEVLAIDICPEMLRHARRKKEAFGLDHIQVEEMDASNIQANSGQFDAVLAGFMLTVVENPDHVLGELARVCRIGGQIVSVNHFRSENRFIGWMEHSLDPICKRFGWRMDLRVSDLAIPPTLELRDTYKMSFYDLFRILCFERIPAFPSLTHTPTPSPATPSSV